MLVAERERNHLAEAFTFFEKKASRSCLILDFEGARFDEFKMVSYTARALEPFTTTLVFKSMSLLLYKTLVLTINIMRNITEVNIYLYFFVIAAGNVGTEADGNLSSDFFL